MGAFAGSAALLCQTRRSDVSVVTLTMNNACNLKCPHCYLQYAESDTYVPSYVIDAVAASRAEAVAIVGMEPLRNRTSAAKLSAIVEAMKTSGKKVGLVTNGLNAHLLPEHTALQLDWVDVSVDGVRASYQSVRGAPVAKLERGIAHLHALGVSQVNILHTLHAENLADLGELAAFGRTLAGAGQVVLSPFAATRHEGSQPRDLAITPAAFLAALRRSEGDLARCWVVLDLDWIADPEDREIFAAHVETEMGGRAVLFRTDPADYGMVRITYDARLMTPRQAMHTRDYRGRTRPLGRAELDSALTAPRAAARLI